MIRVAFIWLFLATSSLAQSFDLETLPENYRFTDHGSDGNTLVRYLGKDDQGYRFHYLRDDSAGEPTEYDSWANRASQLVKWISPEDVGTLIPHDCWPQLGDCDYTITYRDQTTYKLRSNMFVKDGIWFHQRDVLIDGEWFFFERACTRMDEYGFPIDFYAEYWDGKVEWSERVTTMDIPDPRSDLEDLIRQCESAEGLVS